MYCHQQIEDLENTNGTHCCDACCKYNFYYKYCQPILLTKCKHCRESSKITGCDFCSGKCGQEYEHTLCDVCKKRKKAIRLEVCGDSGYCSISCMPKSLIEKYYGKWD